MKKILLTAILLVLSSGSLHAGGADVVSAKALKTGNTWRFDVTVRHADTGWDHYADGWRVFTPDGQEIGYRELLHPHENEQPFTRSLSGVKVPDGVTSVIIRAHDSEHGNSGKAFTLKLR